MIAIVLAAISVAAAQDEPPHSKRVDEIQALFDAAEPGAKRWHTGWLVFNAVSTAANGAAAVLIDDDRSRVGYGIGAGLSVVGVLDLLFFNPFQTHTAASRLRAMDNPTDERAERLLAKIADGEREGRAWHRHAGAFFVAGASWWAINEYGYPQDAWIQAGATLVVSEIMFLSQPASILRASEKDVRISVVPWANGLAVVGRY
ncbi:MAG: hypothetical protein M5R36_04445 [Deltaproteobacteria bacterium]|nr:hypothetical protein [Deltaproteobacteria bacterium]